MIRSYVRLLYTAHARQVRQVAAPGRRSLLSPTASCFSVYEICVVRDKVTLSLTWCVMLTVASDLLGLT